MGEADDELRSLRCAQRDEWTTVRIARIASAQEGIVGQGQLRDCGLSPSTIWRWVQSGRLFRRFPGVYALGHRSLTETSHLVAALLYAGPDAALSHGTGTHWWRLAAAAPAAIHVSTPHKRAPQPGLVLHRPRELERVRHRRLPVTPLPRTLLDFAATASVGAVRKALAQAEFHYALDLSSVAEAAGRGLPGSATLRRALASHLPQLAQTNSTLEDDFLLLCERERLPLPEVNVWIAGHKVDAVWRAERLVGELDGSNAHSSTAQRARDHARDMDLRSQGWTVRRYSWHQVNREPKAVAGDIEAALRERSHELR